MEMVTDEYGATLKQRRAGLTIPQETVKPRRLGRASEQVRLPSFEEVGARVPGAGGRGRTPEGHLIHVARPEEPVTAGFFWLSSVDAKETYPPGF